MQVQGGTKWKGNLFKINHNTGSRPLTGKDYLSLSNYRTFGFHQPSKFATFIFEEKSNGK